MAVITDAAAGWSTGIAISAREYWQVTGGGPVHMTHEAAPVANDGAYVPVGQGLVFSAGQTIRYRLATPSAAVITRTQVG